MTQVVQFFYYNGRIEKLAVFMTWVLGFGFFSSFFPGLFLFWLQSMAGLGTVLLGWASIEAVIDYRRGKIPAIHEQSIESQMMGYPMLCGVSLMLFGVLSGNQAFSDLSRRLIFIFFAAPFLGMAILQKRDKKLFWGCLLFGGFFILGFFLGPPVHSPR